MGHEIIHEFGLQHVLSDKNFIMVLNKSIGIYISLNLPDRVNLYLVVLSNLYQVVQSIIKLLIDILKCLEYFENDV